jgi:hypothetical protein
VKLIALGFGAALGLAAWRGLPQGSSTGLAAVALVVVALLCAFFGGRARRMSQSQIQVQVQKQVQQQLQQVAQLVNVTVNPKAEGAVPVAEQGRPPVLDVVDVESTSQKLSKALDEAAADQWADTSDPLSESVGARLKRLRRKPNTDR